MTRMLMCAIFKEEHLAICNLLGRGKQENKKPGLPVAGLNAILKYARLFAKKSNWKIVEDQAVKESIRSKLKEYKKKTNFNLPINEN